MIAFIRFVVQISVYNVMTVDANENMFELLIQLPVPYLYPSHHISLDGWGILDVIKCSNQFDNHFSCVSIISHEIFLTQSIVLALAGIL
jgi:hypothetical protein